jgi:predicted secreted protein
MQHIPTPQNKNNTAFAGSEIRTIKTNKNNFTSQCSAGQWRRKRPGFKAENNNDQQ